MNVNNLCLYFYILQIDLIPKWEKTHWDFGAENEAFDCRKRQIASVDGVQRNDYSKQRPIWKYRREDSTSIGGELKIVATC